MAARPAPVVRAAPHVVAQSAPSLVASLSLRMEPAPAIDASPVVSPSTSAKAPSKPATEAIPAPSAGAAAEVEEGDVPNEPCANAAAGSELWIVSTRNLPIDRDCCAPRFAPGVMRFICGRGFVPSSLTALIADEDPERPTIIFVHGNDNEADDAAETGIDLYNRLLSSRCAAPIRLIVWSWPSEEVVKCVRKDARIKACRTNIEGYFLAAFLDLLPPQIHVGVAGYSYGARVVTGGLHVLGGGTLEGRRLAERKHADRDTLRCVLMAAAMDNTWLLPGMRHERAVSQVQRMVITISRVDPVLYFYPMLWGCGGPDALGATGLINAGSLGPEAMKTAHVDVTQAVHRRHGWDNFAESPEIMSLLRHELMHWPAAVAAP
ncbi:MAG TPA: hypothetical protein VGJ26_20005 [Pirellulales bacterium]|jgi:hypothetical protein